MRQRQQAVRVWAILLGEAGAGSSLGGGGTPFWLLLGEAFASMGAVRESVGSLASKEQRGGWRI